MPDVTYSLIVPIAGAGAAVAAILASIPVVQELLAGAGIGALVAKLLTRRLERRRGSELPGPRIRQIDAAWITFGALTGALVGALLAAVQ